MLQELIIELQYLPPIAVFEAMAKTDKVWIEQHENYQKGSFRNRAHIAGPNGQQRISIPLQKGKHEQQNIRDTRIAYHEPWRQQHWQAIRTAYSNAPYFDFYGDTFHAIYQKKWDFLFDFNWRLLETLGQFTGTQQKLSLSSSYKKEYHKKVVDWRGRVTPKNYLNFESRPYRQVFEEKHGFLPNLSILDLLFCKGPETPIFLENQA